MIKDKPQHDCIQALKHQLMLKKTDLAELGFEHLDLEPRPKCNDGHECKIVTGNQYGRSEVLCDDCNVDLEG